jgi:hypothetical protein
VAFAEEVAEHREVECKDSSIGLVPSPLAIKANALLERCRKNVK